MRLHRNAKTSPKMRQLLVTRVTQLGWSRAAAAAAAGVSVRTVAKWVHRLRGGDQTLEDRSSRPHGQPRAWIRPRWPRSWPTDRRARPPGRSVRGWALPRSTVTRVLQRAGLNRVSRLDPPAVIQRYEWPAAGDLLHLDIKPLGRIRGIGHRIHRNLAVRARGVGYEHTRTWPSMTPRAWPMSKSGGRNADGPVRRFSRTRCGGFGAAASPSTASSPTTGRATNPAGLPGCAARGSSGIGSPALTRPGPTAKPSASSKHCSGSGRIAGPT